MELNISIITNIFVTGSNCDIVFHSSKSKNGTFTTPLFPKSYPARTFCRIEFIGQGKERIQISFPEFSLPSDDDNYNCQDSDNLQVLVPIRHRYEPIEILCGDFMPKPIMSDGSKMLLEFRGRKSGKGNRGFRGEYKFLENYGIITGKQLPTGDCAFAYNVSDGRDGWFHSPNFPGAYPRNIECNYYFYGGQYDKIHIRFSYFDVEGVYPCDEESASDYVEFSNFMSEDRKFIKYCGKYQSFSVRSDGKFFRITFRTNDRFDKTGFRAHYEFVAYMPPTENPNNQKKIQKPISGKACGAEINIIIFIIVYTLQSLIKVIEIS
ncbi:suppressor of lurcher protein 1-like [Condylostylus longicornis]|uniref:suppressor of lurcher protein 1-like n=1 Tax=Condylostylus longicornis TaxID=2530218 RepID=UPI00244E3798|nr:suppressor of lurcher protein 1-like [Condylostylus longicornis]